MKKSTLILSHKRIMVWPKILPCVKHRSIKLMVLMIILVLVVLICRHRLSKPNDETIHQYENPIFRAINYHHGHLRFDDDNSDNETGLTNVDYIVPDLVHYIQFENPFLDFITLISILSTVHNHRPRLIMIHTDRMGLKGKYWQRIVQLNSSQTDTAIILNHIKRPTYIFHRKLSSIYHSSDIARILVLTKYGGIYLDNDVYVVKSLHKFRRFEFVIGWPPNQNIGTQILICHRNARFLRLWYESYHDYKPDRWYYNAGELPTKKILQPKPNLVHRVWKEFGVDNLAQMLYNELNRNWSQQYYAIHLLARHRSYLIKGQKEFRYFNEYNIENYNRTFGEMARAVLNFGAKAQELPTW